MTRRTAVVAVLLLELIAIGCGGGGGGGTSPPPPPPPPPPAPSPDFGISAIASSSAQQGGLGATVSISINSLAGFGGTVAISFEGMSPGVSVSPSTGISIGTGQAFVVVANASLAVPTGSSTVTVRGINGSLNHTTTFTFTITPAAAFHISLSAASVTLNPGTTTTAQITMTASPGSSTNAQISVNKAAGLVGVGVDVTSAQTFIAPGQTVTLNVQANLNVESKSVPFQITAQIGPDVSSVDLLVTVSNPFAASAPPSRTTFVRTDQEVIDAVYDPARKLVFATVHDLNKVEVFTSSGQRVTTIAVPRPAGIDQAPDGSILVASRTSGLYKINPDTLEISERVFLPRLGTSINVMPFELRTEIVRAANNGLALVTAFEANTTSKHLLKWNLATGAVTDLGFTSFELLARSLDYGTLVLASFSTSGSDAAIYDPANDTIGVHTARGG